MKDGGKKNCPVLGIEWRSEIVIDKWIVARIKRGCLKAVIIFLIFSTRKINKIC